MTSAPAGARPIRAYGHVVAGLSRNAKLYLSCSLLRAAALSVFELFFNLYLLSMGLDAAFIGVANTLLGIASIASSLPAGMIADRIGRKRAMLAGLAGLLVTHLGIILVRQGWAIIGFFVLYGLLAPLLYASIAPSLTLFFKQRFAVPDSTLGWIIGVTSAVAVPTMLVGGAVAERLGKIRAAFISRLISTPLLLLIGLAPSLPVAVAAHWIRGGFMRLGQPLYISFAMEQLVERERATGSSLLRVGWDAGWSLGPLVGGLLQARLGFTPLILATFVFYMVGSALIYFFFDPLRRGVEKPGLPLE